MPAATKSRATASKARGVAALAVAPTRMTPATLIARLIQRKATFAALYSASQMDRIQMVKEGVPSSFVAVLVSELDMSKERFYGIIGVARATVDRKVKTRTALDRAESEGVLAMARLIGQVEEMVRTSGNPEGFDAARWVADWLQQPLPALGGQCPADYMDTEEGRALVSGLVAQMQSGAYA